MEPKIKTAEELRKALDGVVNQNEQYLPPSERQKFRANQLNEDPEEGKRKYIEAFDLTNPESCQRFEEIMELPGATALHQSSVSAETPRWVVIFSLMEDHYLKLRSGHPIEPVPVRDSRLWYEKLWQWVIS